MLFTGDSVSEGGQGFEPQVLTSQPQTMEELVAQAMPGTSGLQGVSVCLLIPLWCLFPENQSGGRHDRIRTCPYLHIASLNTALPLSLSLILINPLLLVIYSTIPNFAFPYI